MVTLAPIRREMILIIACPRDEFIVRHILGVCTKRVTANSFVLRSVAYRSDRDALQIEDEGKRWLSSMRGTYINTHFECSVVRTPTSLKEMLAFDSEAYRNLQIIVSIK